MAIAWTLPRVSVLLAVHNGALHLREGIDSVLAQTWPDFELVVVDDASTDATPAILAGLADPRLRVMRTERNLGPAAARNLGFDRCRGEYLAILDHDDLCYPAQLATQVAYLDRNPHVVLVGSEVRILRDGRLHAPDHPPGGAPLLMRWRLHLDDPLTFSSVTMRMDAVRQLGTQRRRFRPSLANFAARLSLGSARGLARGRPGGGDEARLGR